MQEKELETQEVEEIKGEEAQASQATPAAEPPVQKRATVAGLKKELDALKQDMNRDVLEWLGQLDVRLEEVEKRTAAHNEALLGDAKTRLDTLESIVGSGEMQLRLAAEQRLETLESAIGALTDAVRSHITDTEGLPQSPAAAAGFTTAPGQQVKPVPIGFDMPTVATKCQTMTDVLMICRALKEDPTLTDAERNEILKIATRAANVPITQGLQIRAGVRNVAE